MVEELAGRLRENQALTRQLIKTQEQERRRIAADIHEHAVQEIIGTRMKLESAVKDRSFDTIGSARDELQDVIDYLRSVIGELRPRASCFSDLEKMLKQHAAAFQRRRELPVVVHISGNSAVVPEEVRSAIFWVFHEGLTNAWKHAKATRIEANLDIQPDRVRLEIQDDGRGFDMPPYLDELLADGHLGLMEMREWIAFVGGRFDIMTGSGRGSRLVADVPLHAGRPEEDA
jgi:signal transduction histidine kinase